MKNNRKQAGFTLLEILVVIGIIAILAAVVIVALNPAKQFAQARNTQRWSNVNTILNGVWQRMVDSRGVWTTSGACTDSLPASSSYVGALGVVDLEPCLVPTYVSQMVLDPSGGTTDNTGYWIFQDSVSGRVTVSAPNGAAETADPQTISVTR